MRKLGKKATKKDEVAEMKREMARVKREANAKIRALESQGKSQAEELGKKEDEIGKLKADLLRKDQVIEKNKEALSLQKKESSLKVEELESKVKEITAELEKKEEDLQAFKKLFDERESELNRLRKGIEKKSQGLTAKDRAGERMEAAKVVVRYADGRIIKGYTKDFSPTNPSFYVRRHPPGTQGDPVEILVRDLKAVFFVRDFLGDPRYQERKEFFQGVKIIGKVMEVTFKAGELIVGSSLSYDSERPGFFLSPADPKGNNLGVFVVSQAVSKVRYL
jgi:hypothetical protein